METKPYSNGALILLSSLISRRLAEPELAQPKMDHRVQAVIDLMTSDLRGASLDKLARHVNLSTSRLWHLFKNETSLAPAQYLKQLRLQAVTELLLKYPWWTVNQIQGEVGYLSEDQSHFFRDFKREFGMTPTEFRAHYLAARSNGRQASETDN